ncbi:MAG: DnaD domain protein [Christensenellales bacterium]
MNFCTTAAILDDNGYTVLKNKFITDYLPQCDEIQLKVYLYGLYLSSGPLSVDNSLDNMCAALDLEPDEIEKAYDDLSRLGLVSIVSLSPLSIRYNTLTQAGFKKHFKAEKYADFNRQLESIFGCNLTLPSQYLPYYEFMEESKISPEVLLMITKYCVGFKNDKIKPNYVITVAKNWLSEGVRTIEDVENRIMQQEMNNEGLRAVGKALNKKSEMTVEDKDLFVKWTKNWGFDTQTILAAVKTGKIKGSMTKLDGMLDECFRNNALSQTEVESYIKNKKHLKDLAYEVNKKLGLHYDIVDGVVEKYISPWLAKGLEEDAILLIAEYCFSNSVRTLEGMNNVANKFIREGRLSVIAINDYLSERADIDNTISKLLEACGTTRNVLKSDREQYAVWKSWGFDDDVIKYACEQSVGKNYPMGNAHSLLSRWRQAGLDNLEAIKNLPSDSKTKNNTSGNNKCGYFNVSDRKYTKEELSSFLSSIDDLGELI